MSEMYQVTKRKVPPAGCGANTPTHYWLQAAEPDPEEGAHRVAEFYKFPSGRDIAVDVGYGKGPVSNLPDPAGTYAALKAAVEQYEQEHP